MNVCGTMTPGKNSIDHEGEDKSESFSSLRERIEAHDENDASAGAFVITRAWVITSLILHSQRISSKSLCSVAITRLENTPSLLV